MKIVFVSDAIYPYNKGGKEKRLFDLSTRLASKGHDVHIYTMKWWTSKGDLTENGVHMHALCPLYPLYSGERRSIAQGILFGLSCLKLITQKWDVIDVDHMPYFPLYFTKLVCLLKGKRMIATWHEVWGKEYWMKYLGGWKGHVAWWVEKFSIDMPDRIIAVSDSTANRLRNDLHYTRKMDVVYNGVDETFIRAITPDQIKSDIMFAGRLLTHKHVDKLIEAVALLQKTNANLVCIIIGNGPEKESLIKLTESLHLQHTVMFYDFFGDERKLYALMKSSRVFVLPSDREGFGLVVLEANACDLPVVTSDAPDNHAQNLITDDNGVTVNVSDIPVFAKAISTIISRPKAHIQIDPVYNIDTIISQMEGIYNS